MKIHASKAATRKRLGAVAPVCAALIGGGLFATGLPVQAELEVSGHVAYNLVDRDSINDPVFQRNGYSESRFRFIYNRELESGLRVQVAQEFGIAEGEGALDARRQEVIFRGDFGGVRFGQGNDAGDGNLNGDLSGTMIIHPLSSLASAFGYSSSNYNGFDPGRGERLRYDSPKFGGGAVVSVQFEEDKQKEIGLRYNAEVPGGRLRVGAFIADTDSADEDSSGILIAYALENGINFAVASSSKDDAAGPGEDGDFSAVKIGYKTGKHAVSIMSGTSENPANLVETDTTGIAYVYLLDKGIELYAASQEFDSDNNAVDEDFIVLGSRIKF